MKELSPEDRQHRLNEATKKYSRGQISKEEYRAIERDYLTEYDAAIFELARKDIGQRIIGAIENFIFRHPKKVTTKTQ